MAISRRSTRKNSTVAVGIATIWQCVVMWLLAITSTTHSLLSMVAASELPTEFLLSAKTNETTTAAQHASRERRRLLSSSSSSSSSYHYPKPLPFLLGVMVDAGRHDVPVEWLQSFVTMSHRMGFNALHLRLTSDQKFAIGDVHWKDWKRLAQHAKQLDDFVILPEVSLPFFAASWADQEVLGSSSLRHNTNASIIATSRRSPLPPPNCPKYACSSERAFPTVGTNLPLDLGHPDLPETIRRLLRNLTSALDQPAYLHLGARSSTSTSSTNDYHQHDCWKEALKGHRTNEPKQRLDRLLRDQYQRFETILEGILANDLGYRSQVVRSADGTPDEKKEEPLGATETEPVRTPVLLQYEDHQRALRDANSSLRRPYLLQPHELNMATTLENNHPTGWEVYRQTHDILTTHYRPLSLREGNKDQDEASSLPLFRGLVVSTDAMPPEWFEPRNVLGRMLAVSMAATDVANKYQTKKATDLTQEAETVPQHDYFIDPTDFERAYLERCHGLFPTTNSEGVDDTDVDALFSSTKDSICDRLGGLKIQAGVAPSSERGVGIKKQPKHSPPRNGLSLDSNYKRAYTKQWKDWADNICHRLTKTRHELEWLPSTHVNSIRDQAFATHWQEGKDDWNDHKEPTATDLEDSFQSQTNPTVLLHEVFGAMHVPVRGLIIDLVDDTSISPAILEDLMERVVAPLGLNALQLSLMNRWGCALHLASLEELHHVVPKPIAEPWTESSLGRIAAAADNLGLKLIPEISATTEALGWYHAGFLVDCPRTLCQKGGDVGAIANDVHRGSLLPVILHVVRKLRRIFTSGSYLHLGSDERRASQACWSESGRSLPDYNAFEQKLSDLLVETFGWYNASNILRWENQEGIVYPQRTGSITHYRYGVPAATLDQSELDPLAFGSLSITPEQTPWSVYLETRKWVERQPQGLLARISLRGVFEEPVSNDNVDQTKMSLLAFAVGLSSQMPILEDASALNAYIADLCNSNNNDSHVLCRMPSELAAGGVQRQRRTPLPRESLLCRAMTRSISRPVMRSSLTSGLDNADYEESVQ
eukprot:jgi/Psemu1/20256/gm1.20256_g